MRIYKSKIAKQDFMYTYINPNMNPTNKWCFTNPPLFYIVSAIFVRFQNFIGRQGYQAIENLQFLTMFFVLVFDVLFTI